MRPPEIVHLTPGKRVLFLTKDPDLIRRQLAGELDLRMEEVAVEDLLDDINTDAMTPAWVCFDHRPEEIARDAYAGLVVDGKRLFARDALRDGNFEVIVSGYRKGVGSSRETAVQAEKWSGIRIAVAASFASTSAYTAAQRGSSMDCHALKARSRHSSSHSGSCFFLEMKRTMSSFSPLGANSISMSVSKPHL